MKKTMRILTLALALVMLVSVMAVSAFAAHKDVEVHINLYEHANNTFLDPHAEFPVTSFNQLSNGTDRITPPLIMELTDPNRTLFEYRGHMYTKNNGVTANNLKKVITTNPENTIIGLDLGHINYLFIAYSLHDHDISGQPWNSDVNNHWKYCKECGRWVMNWHHDFNHDGKCDECGREITYRTVTLKSAEGGTITASADKGMLSDRIALTVTPNEGYHVEAINVINANEAESGRAVFTDVKDAEYHFILDVWDVEVTPVFVKD